MESILENLIKNTTKQDDHDHEHEENNKDVIIAKSTAMIVLFMATIVFGLLPFYLSKWLNIYDEDNDNNNRSNKTKSKLIINLVMSFAGGVLLCTTFQHLLPEVNDNLAYLQSVQRLPDYGFHFAEFLMCMGFFLMFFIEELVHTYLHKQEKKNTIENAFNRGIDIRNSTAAKDTTLSTTTAAAISTNITHLTTSTTQLRDELDIQKQDLQTISHKNYNNFNNNNNNNYNYNQNNDNNNIGTTKRDSCDQHHHHSHFPVEDFKDDLIVSSLRGLLVVLALSIHELFEGLAVGLESTSSAAWYMFGAIASHKLILAFCVGVELVVTKTRRMLLFIYVLIFASVSPLGIGIGIIISNGDDTGLTGVVSVMLQGLAAGTLLYVVFFEILNKHKFGIIQYFAVLIGFFVMFGLHFLTVHEHGGETDSDHNH